ncbi:MAG: hypothetical protein ACK443_09920 [Methylococcaceae bacterium]
MVAINPAVASSNTSASQSKLLTQRPDGRAAGPVLVPWAGEDRFFNAGFFAGELGTTGRVADLEGDFAGVRATVCS